MDPGFVACGIIALSMAVPVTAYDYGMDYVRWGQKILQKFKILAAGERPMDGIENYSVEYQFVEAARTVTNLRYFLTKDKHLYIFTCEGAPDNRWDAVKQQFDGTVRKFRFT
jgi:hypothetical protein